MTEFPANSSDWASFCQLVQQLIAGHVRRHTFTQWEMDLLLDFQLVRLRKSSRPEILRRYLKAVQRQMAEGAPIPMRFSRFFELEAQPRTPGRAAADISALPRAS